MSEFLETTVDKFIFRVASDRFYNQEGVWVKLEADQQVAVGVSDFVQQRSGDVAFADVNPAGTQVELGEEFCNIETIKVDVALTSPVSGEILEVNPELEDAPEVINQDPYSAGWLAKIRIEAWDAVKSSLLTPEEYFEQMKVEAEEESKKL
jgi:glycine cleavage system H protein